MTPGSPASPEVLAVIAPIRPVWWQRGAPRRLRIDAAGIWHVLDGDAVWRSTRPDRIDIGPGGLWLSMTGPLARPERTRDGMRPAARLRATLWARSVEPEQWRRLRSVANWYMQRGDASPAAARGGVAAAPRQSRGDAS